jgi:putative transposase
MEVKRAYQYRFSLTDEQAQQKLSTRIIRENQVICVESLAVKNLLKNHCLAKAIGDVGWDEFVRQLEYKAAWYGRTLVKIDRFFPSNKTCSSCGYVLETLALEIREWMCPACGACHNRDHNAAQNILIEGLPVLVAGRVASACGEAIRPGRVKVLAGKPQRNRKPRS